jgi:hypothetical protein
VTDYPHDLRPNEISPELAALVRSLASRMLDSPAPEHHVLREQLEAARLSRITLTGAGLYAYFEHPPGAQTVSPPEMIGGDVPMEVRTLDAPAGSLLKISGGLLDFVEIYTFGDHPWPDEPQIVEFGEATPLPVPGDDQR